MPYNSLEQVPYSISTDTYTVGIETSTSNLSGSYSYRSPTYGFPTRGYYTPCHIPGCEYCQEQFGIGDPEFEAKAKKLIAEGL